ISAVVAAGLLVLGYTVAMATGSTQASDLPESSSGKLISCTDSQGAASFSLRAQRVLVSGAVDTAWTPDSTRLCLGSMNGLWTERVSDGAGGAYVGWVDSRTDESDIYLQRFDD